MLFKIRGPIFVYKGTLLFTGVMKVGAIEHYDTRSQEASET